MEESKETYKNLHASGHDPVLPVETVDFLVHSGLGSGATIVDCTAGRGGHSLLLAQKLPPGSVVLSIDRDERNLVYASERLKPVSDRVRFFHANFSEIATVVEQAGYKQVDGILADLGISTNQLFDERYGLSFQTDMPLDMRLDATDTTTAADIVNRWPEQKIADALYNLADERWSYRIARKIVEERAHSPITSTRRLADIVRQVVRHAAKPARSSAESIDPATRTFMALRMAVNAEIENLQTLLTEAPKLLAPQGRFAVISFHSTEDRVVKQAFKRLADDGAMELLTKKPIEPSDDEVRINPRSRSAKLRVIRRP
jgi:16S rRNA (cytosine1402-N4)-methyltransferase